MGKRGPAPEPTRLKLLKGATPGRVNFNEPQPLDTEVLEPDWLSPYAADEWRHIAPHLIAMGTLTDADTAVLAVYCEAVARWRRIAELVGKSPPLLTREGQPFPVKNPLYAQVRDAAIEVRLFAREFGLTPSARAGIQVHVHSESTAARLLTGDARP